MRLRWDFGNFYTYRQIFAVAGWYHHTTHSMPVVLSPDLVLYPTVPVHLAVSVLVLLRLLLLVKPGRGVVGRHGQDHVEGGTNPI